MPEVPAPKHRPHPWRTPHAPGTPTAFSRTRPEQDAYAELHVTTNFTFLTGASHPEEYVARAAELGHRALAVTDRNSLAGIVRAHVAAKEAGLPLAVGCRLVFDDAPLTLLAYATDRAAYGRLCRLLTLGKRRAAKGSCSLRIDDLLEHQRGLLVVALPEAGPAPEGVPDDDAAPALLQRLAHVFDDDRLSIGAAALFGSDDRRCLEARAVLARRTGLPLVATNDVHYHLPERRPLQDVLTAIRHGCTVESAGFRLFPHAERHLKSARSMTRLFRRHATAVPRAVEIAERAAAFSLDELSYQYPSEVAQPGLTPMQSLVTLTWAGAAERYPAGVPDKIRGLLEHEFELVAELDYAPYFLTVHDLVRFARSRGILCQGRGAAANSAICYCLGVTSVDPDRIDLLFERFVSKERNEPPDIDIDFEHERREEVIQYIYAKYGRDRAALTAEVITYRARSAIRDVGKALGFSLDCVDRLAGDVDWWHQGAADPERLQALGLDPNATTTRLAARLTGEILGFPRHLSQHVGGFVITEGLLSELVPIENAAMADRTVIEWDKDDIDAMGMLKVDVLGLGMLTCVRKAFALLEQHADAVAFRVPHGSGFALHTIPPEDPAVYDMICAADTVGVFQIESRAQMTMLPRLRPREFYDLVIEVAIVRPGPIQGDMVHPYLRRRNGEEQVSYPTPGVRKVLQKTLGVPLFQEQAMALAMVAGGFTPGEADELRRAMAAWRRKGGIERFRDRLVDGMCSNGCPLEFAERFFQQIKGFSEYGFPESHAASFALLVYVSAWLKYYAPAAFAAALINSQPMGFYAPAQLVRDAQQHGVEVRPIDVQHSTWDCTLEHADDEHGAAPADASSASGESPVHDGPAGQARHGADNGVIGNRGRRQVMALRLGMRLVKGLRQVDAEAMVAAVRQAGPFQSLEALHRASGVRIAALKSLAYADALQSLGLDRQSGLWQVRTLRDEVVSLFSPRPGLAVAESASGADAAGHAADNTSAPAYAPPALPEISPLRKVAHDYASQRLSLKAHPLSFLRPRLDELGVVPASRLADEEHCRQGAPVRTAGLVLVRQRPATAKGIIFMTLEDETGTSNLLVHAEVFERYRQAARHAVVLLARGRVDRAGPVVHVIVKTLENLDGLMGRLASPSRDFR